MTKNEAISALAAGSRVAHRHFSSDEWVMRVGFRYHFEDGCNCWPEEFWRHRTDPSWNDWWRVVEPPAGEGEASG